MTRKREFSFSFKQEAIMAKFPTIGTTGPEDRSVNRSPVHSVSWLGPHYGPERKKYCSLRRLNVYQYGERVLSASATAYQSKREVAAHVVTSFFITYPFSLTNYNKPTSNEAGLFCLFIRNMDLIQNLRVMEN